MFKHILLPTDGSEPSARAVRLGVALAKQTGARVHAFHVLTPLAAISHFSDLIRHEPDDYENEAIARAQGHLEAVRVLAKEAGVGYEGSYAFDPRTYTAIVGAAHRYDCDLIVMGTHGHTGLDRLVLGSETNKVLGCADIPVLVCR